MVKLSTYLRGEVRITAVTEVLELSSSNARKG